MFLEFDLSLLKSLEQNSILFLCLGALLSGIVKGFAGFGTAMVFLPFAGQFLAPSSAIIAMAAMDILGPIPAIPRALREGTLHQVARLLGASLVAIPLGFIVLTLISAESFRYIVSITSLSLFIILLMGWRLVRPPSVSLQYGTGFCGGFLGGATGLPGPPVILLYMASPMSPSQIRANFILYLVCADIIIFMVVALAGNEIIAPAMIGLMLVIPYMIAVKMGTWLFNPDKERLYRAIGYMIIVASALRGLPLWENI